MVGRVFVANLVQFQRPASLLQNGADVPIRWAKTLAQKGKHIQKKRKATRTAMYEAPESLWMEEIDTLQDTADNESSESFCEYHCRCLAGPNQF